MLFPIGDENRRGGRTAWVTYVLLAANLAVFFLLQQAGANEEFTYGWSVVPEEIVEGRDITETQRVTAGSQSVDIPHQPGPAPIYITLISAMFMHGGFMHLFGNMLYLWIFGDNVERRFGAGPFLAFYLVSGLAASVAQIALDPSSIIPNLGASGAISGVLGAYLVLFPKNKVHAIFLYFIVSVPAVVAIGLWIVFQFVNGLGAVAASEATIGGVAYGAHIGGFFAGILLATILRVIIKKEKPNVYSDSESRRR